MTACFLWSQASEACQLQSFDDSDDAMAVSVADLSVKYDSHGLGSPRGQID
jgi:hypothetical protein